MPSALLTTLRYSPISTPSWPLLDQHIQRLLDAFTHFTVRAGGKHDDLVLHGLKERLGREITLAAHSLEKDREWRVRSASFHTPVAYARKLMMGRGRLCSCTFVLPIIIHSNSAGCVDPSTARLSIGGSTRSIIRNAFRYPYVPCLIAQ